MVENQRLSLFEGLPSHLILVVLISGGLSVMDLVNIELTSKLFGLNNEEDSSEFKSLAEHAASRLCYLHPVFAGLSPFHQKELLERCNENWKRVLRFLQCMVRSCDRVLTSNGQLQIITGYNYSVVNNSMVHSCGSDEPGAFPPGPVDLPFSSQVAQVSTRNNKVAYVTQSGEVFTCERAVSGSVDTTDPIYTPKRVDAMHRTPCKQVDIGTGFTVFLTREGHVYTVGENTYGQLGHGDTMERQVPKMVEGLEKIIQISVGANYVLALSEDGTVYSFGDGSDLCLGDGSVQPKLQPQPIQTFKTEGVHILSVSAGDRHAVALASNGYVYRWGQRHPGVVVVGTPDRIPTPEVILLGKRLVLQVCAQNMKTIVLLESASLYMIL